MKERIQLISPEAINFDAELEASAERARDVEICVVNPPSKFLLDETVFPTLAGGTIVAALREIGNRPSYLDLAGEQDYVSKMKEFVKNNPEITHYGLTATTPQLKETIIINRTIKEANPNATTILGGPHVTFTHGGAQIGPRAQGEYLRLQNEFDILVIGDGEKAIIKALDPEDHSQILDAGNLKSPLFLAKGTLDNYPTPARDIMGLERYRYYIDGHRATSVIGQRGCPFGCGFCGGRHLHSGRIARERDHSHVIHEIEEIVAMSQGWDEPITAIMFYDDELNITTDNLEHLCDELGGMQDRLGIKMRFRGFVKAERFTQRQANLMAEAGFSIVLSGIESGSDLILKEMNKKTTRATNSQLVEFAHNAGLNVKALMSIGHPGESEQTIRESIEWALLNLKPGDDIDWTVITPYPGAPYYDATTKMPDGSWKYVGPLGGSLYSKDLNYAQDVGFYKGIPGEYVSYVWTDYLSSQELVQWRDRAENITRKYLGLDPIQAINQRGAQHDHSMGQGNMEKIIYSSQPQ